MGPRSSLRRPTVMSMRPVVAPKQPFYDRGRRGVTVEPTPYLFAALCDGRPEDVNLPVAIGQQASRVDFQVAPTRPLGVVDCGRPPGRPSLSAASRLFSVKGAKATEWSGQSNPLPPTRNG